MLSIADLCGAVLRAEMDTLGIEPRAFRMRSGCDTTTPCARDSRGVHLRCWSFIANGLGSVCSGLCVLTGWALYNSATGTRTRVARVRAEYPNQLDYSGVVSCWRPLRLCAFCGSISVCRACVGFSVQLLRVCVLGVGARVCACVHVCTCVYVCLCVGRPVSATVVFMSIGRLV